MKRPVVLGCCLWITGYVLAMYIELPWLSLTASVVLLGLAAALLMFRLPARQPLCMLLLVGAALGFYHWYDQRNVSALLRLEPKQELLDGSEVTLLGRIGSPVTVDGDRASFTVEADAIRFQSGDAFPLGGESVQVSLRLMQQAEQDVAARWRRGDAATLAGTLRSPSPARNFGGFDYRRYLRFHRIHWLLTAKGADQARVEPATPKRFGIVTLLRWNDELRDSLSRRADAIFPPKQAGFMKSMLIGMKDDLDPDRFQQFSELGLTHILAISGLHVAVFLGVCIWLMKKLRLTKETYLLVCIALLPMYILLTGASPSVTRAGLMSMIVLYAIRRGVIKDALHIAAISAWVMLVVNPYYLLDVSFQLSFLVTVGLIVGVQRVSELCQEWIRSAAIRNMLSITLVSQLISFPVSIYYFNQFSLLSWAANACLVPIISMVIFPLGMTALVVGLVSIPVGHCVGWLLSWLNECLFWVTDHLQMLREFKTIWPSPSMIWIAAYYGLLVLIYCALHAHRLLELTKSPLQILVNQQANRRRHLLFLGMISLSVMFLFLLYMGYSLNASLEADWCNFWM
ncbi:ComEC/Rec2 family competence protein [Paenibacillus hexagrammi]|uniref:ComEC family competence protein n=1 Tax=Paenibacillus hexagrammi TaxID=2908839 RepID=A0ABY3SPA1_9BACL|nr:ComEC/Rec2 family competence protein [Paenibacillus sp. YPD9-1]UJF35031.1 ComEC family competence protein [Paenibacillus sp. YPD9-1]